jgi:hypothetical protein
MTGREQPAPASVDPARDHRGLRVLTLEECLNHLKDEPVGRLAFVHDGDPVILPVNHAVDGLDVVFRSTWGSKLEVARHAGSVAFEVDGYDAEAQTGWSVLVSGIAEAVYDAEESARLDSLPLRSWAGISDPTFWVRVRAEQVTGRAVEHR